MTEIPGCIADCNAAEGTEAGGNLEAGSLQGYGPIAPPLAAGNLLTKSKAQIIDRRTFTTDIRRFKKTPQRRHAGLGMDRALILHLNPGLGGLIQKGEIEILGVV